MANVLLIGSSHINRLRQYVNDFNLQNFGLIQPQVSMYGISGGRIKNNHHCGLWSNEVTRVGPYRILVQFGGNDLDCENANEQSAEEIMLRLISICSLYLSRPNVEHVTILQLLPRHETRHCPPVVYNNLVRHANTYLKEQIQAVPGLHYWNIYGVKNSAVNIFVDGVHFNQDGVLRYYRNVRGAIVQFSGY